MSEELIAILCAIAVVVILVTLIETVTGSFRPGSRGITSICIGIDLLIVGGILTTLEPYEILARVPLLEEPDSRKVVRDFVGFLIGGLFLGCGVIARFSSGAARGHIQYLNETMGQQAKELSSTQELLTSVVRSSLSGVMILQVIRDETGMISDFQCRLMNEEASVLAWPRVSLRY